MPTLFCLLLALSGTAWAASTPRIVCPDPVHDFGARNSAESIEHVFTIRNEGEALLEIGNVRACCGASASIADKLIQPGSNTPLKVVFSLAGRTGRQNKTFYVGSNDPKEPYLQLRLVGDVLQPLDIQPRSVDFGVLAAGTTTNAEVVVTVHSNLSLNVTNVSADPCFGATLRKDAGRAIWRISITPKTPPLGLTRGRIAIQTDHKDYSRVEIPVSVVMASDIVVVPSEIVLAAVGAKLEPVVRYVVLRSLTGQPFRILEVVAPDPGIVVSQSSMTSGGYRITLANVRPLADLNGKELVVVTDHPKMKRVTVPFLVTRQQ